MTSTKRLIFSLLAIFVAFACKKDTDPSEPSIPDTSGCDYLSYSTDSFPKMYKQLEQPLGRPAFPYFLTRYHYTDPVFNADNPYEIAYVRETRTEQGDLLASELWKFSLCTGLAQKLADTAFFTPDWSVRGWIIFTGSQQQLYKVSQDGDLLVQLTDTAGLHWFGRWSPSGNKLSYFYDRQQAILADKDGRSLQVLQPVWPVYWISDEVVLGEYNGGPFASYNIATGSLVENHFATNSGNTSFINLEEGYLYGSEADGYGNKISWQRYNLQSKTFDTLRELYDSYHYGAGDYHPRTNKAIVSLKRREWKDSVQNVVSVRHNLLLMNPEGTEERLVLIPE